MVKKSKVLEKKLERFLERSLQLLKKKNLGFEVYLVSNAVIRKLNRRYRKKNKVTNVLAFPNNDFPRPDARRRHLGEIYLAPDYIRSRQEDITGLAVHGLLHLLGFAHRRKNDRIKMEKKEQWLMSSLR